MTQGILFVPIPPEPEGDRPVVADHAGDVWQRRDGVGTPTWFAAVPQLGTVCRSTPANDADPQPFARGRAWAELVAVFGPVVPVEVPAIPDPPYTGELPVQRPEPAHDR